MKRYPAILSALYNTPLLVTPAKLAEIETFIRRRALGQAADEPAVELADDDEPLVRIHGADGSVARMTGKQLLAQELPAAATPAQEFLAILPLFGTIFQHGGLEMSYSGGTATEQWQRQLRKLDANPAVKTVIIETHSPGGQAIGTQETADLVRAVREAGKTRLVSIANSMMASAATWIGTATKEVYATPGGEIGSIGVVTLHWDYSAAYANEGIKPTLIATSRAKILGNEFEALDEAALAQFQHDNGVVYQAFLKGMAANRGTTPAKVEADYGGGSMLFARDAVKAGLADGVATLQELTDRELARLNRAPRRSMKNAMAIAQAKAQD